MDSIQVHSKSVTKLLKTLNIETALEFNRLAVIKERLIPRQKVCYNCLAKLKSQVRESNNTDSMESEDDICVSDFNKACDIDGLNQTLREVECSPLKPTPVSKRNMESYVKRKTDQIGRALKEK